MEYSNNQDKSEFERHKSKIQENIDMGKNMGINKISAILKNTGRIRRNSNTTHKLVIN